MDLAVSEVRLHGRRLFTGTVRDISARRELETEVLRIAEGERRRIGQDLHDGLGQMLTGTALIARGLARTLHTAGSASAADADEVVALIKEADAQARALARGLVPVELESNGLAAALERLAANTSHLFGITCTFEATGEPDAILRDPIPTHLFRIAQEAVSNAVRHGRAARVSVSLLRRPDQLRLIIRDDGVGIAGTHRTDALADDPPPDANRGLGVRIMHYRARVLSATLELRPGADGGTVVTCTLPPHALR
jgi:signal transduction histidine kinase